MRLRSRILFGLFIVLCVGGIAAALKLPRLGAKPDPEIVATGDTSVDLLPSLDGASGWLNGERSSIDSLRGKMVVLALWSDTDPRALDALPRIQSWHDAYARYGVRVIGVYAPEFSFGVDSTVPTRIARRLGLTFPIALDPSYQVRSRLGAAAAGGILIADSVGHVLLGTDLEQLDRVDHAIREALHRSRPDIGIAEAPDPGPSAPRVIHPVPLGAGRVETGPLASVVPGRPSTFTTQFRFQEEGKDYVPYPVGRWVATAEGLVADRGGAADFVAVRNPGERVFAVMSPRPSGISRVWILADSGWLSASERGADVRTDARGASYVEVDEPRLYEIARSGSDRVLRFSPEEPGLIIHQFTFEKVPKGGGARS